jgi:SAM-dependent methyltransferase
MTEDDARPWTDRSWLQDIQYRTDANLAARQSIYAWQRPRLDLPGTVLGLAGLHGEEAVIDVGCGNGAYLAELARREHAGRVLGVDLSVGMLRAARDHTVRLVAGDAAALPLRAAVSDVTLAVHMLYHVPEPAVAVRELRRITRGRVLVVLNGQDHLRELRDLIATTYTRPERLRLDDGEELLASHFTSVVRHDFTGELLIPGPQPVEAYVRSMSLPDSHAILRRIATDGGPFRIRTHSGCLICS